MFSQHSLEHQHFAYHLIHQRFSHKPYFAPDRSKLKLADSRSLVLVLVGWTIYIYFNFTQLKPLRVFISCCFGVIMNTALLCLLCTYRSHSKHVTFKSHYKHNNIGLNWFEPSNHVLQVSVCLEDSYQSNWGQSGCSVH